MTVNEAAAYLEVSRQTIMRMIKDGRLTPIDPPRAYRKKQRIRFDTTAVRAMRPN